MANVTWETDEPPTEDEAEDAFEQAKALQRRDPIKKPNVDEYFGPSNRPALVGATDHVSKILRGVIADRFSGLTVRESCERFGISRETFYDYKSKHKPAWDQALQEIQEYVVQNINANVWIISSALSDIGPHAVRTLYEIISNPRTPPNTRKDAAVQILKLLDIDGSVGMNAPLAQAAHAVQNLAEATREKFKDERIVEAIDADYVDSMGEDEGVD